MGAAVTVSCCVVDTTVVAPLVGGAVVTTRVWSVGRLFML